MRRALVLALLGLLAGAPAAGATTIAPTEAAGHVGQTVTVEGPVSGVKTARSGITFLDMGGRYPDNAFVAVILKADAAKFPDVAALEGHVVRVTGPVTLYRGKPQIVLTQPGQLERR